MTVVRETYTSKLLLVCWRTWSWRTSWTSCRWIVELMLELEYELAVVMELLSLFVSLVVQ